MDKILFYEEWLEFAEAMERIIQENNYSDDVASEKYKAGWDFFLSEFVKDKSEYIDSNLDKWHKDYLEQDQDNQNYIESIWGKAFALYKCYIESSTRFSNEFFKYREECKVKTDENKFIALAYINGRAIQVANEIFVLMKNGYADAAYARFRTLYELSVIADFIDKHGDNVAKAYIEYDGNWYEWASCIITNKPKDKIRFTDIEKESNIEVKDLSLWRNEYHLSCKLVHASTQGTFARLSETLENGIPVGPNYKGFVVSATNSLESLYHINAMLLKCHNQSLPLLWVNILREIKEKSYIMFHKIESELKDAEEQNHGE